MALFLGRAARGGSASSSGHSSIPNLPPFASNPHNNQTLGLPPVSANSVPKLPEAPPASATAGRLPTPPTLLPAPASLPQPPLSSSAAAVQAAIQRPQSAGQTASRKSATSCPTRTSPTTNNKQRTYPCGECGKIFNAHYNLTRHMPVHTGNF